MRLLRLCLAVNLICWSIGNHAGVPHAEANPTTIYQVVSTLDEPDAVPGNNICMSLPSGVCTLRAAIMEANVHGGADIISFVATGVFTLTIPPLTGDIIGANGDLDIIEDLTVDGPGVTVSASGIADRVLEVTTGTVTLQNLTIRAGDGLGGLYLPNSASVTLENVTVTNNAGVGILLGNTASLTLRASTISNNSGGGINNSGTGTVTLYNSTLSGNTNNGGNGGGLSVSGGVAQLNNVTIVNNGALRAGGVYNSGGSVLLKNSLLASNSGTLASPNCLGTLTSLGYNLIGDLSGCTFVTNTGDLTGAPPSIGPLQNNGGPTLTHALLANSLALNAGNPLTPGTGGNACEISDQRSTLRPQGGRCDIGAFELPAAQFSQGTYTVTENLGPAIITATLDGTSALTVTLNYTTSNGTAVAGSDYTTTTGLLTFSPGISVMTFTIPIIDDATEESDETVSLTMGNVSGASLDSPNSATLTIVDDDEPLRLFLPIVARNSTNCYLGPLEKEPNETGATATGPLCFGQTYTGAYSPPAPNGADSDYFRLTLSQAGTFTTKLTISIPGSGLQLQIRDASLAVLGFDGSWPFQITCPSASDPVCSSGGTLPAGTYYVRVFLPAGFTGSSTYTLTVTTP